MGITNIDPGTGSERNPEAFFNFPRPDELPPPNPHSGENRLVCGFNFGTSNVNGTTGCGLYAILRAAYDNLRIFGSTVVPSNLFFNDLSCFSFLPADFSTKNPIFVIQELPAFISKLNDLHNSINHLIFNVDFTRTDPTGNPAAPTAGEQILLSNSNAVAQYNFYTNYLFYGSYTGKENVNPDNVNVVGELPPGDLGGNGITAAFAFANPIGEGMITPRDGHASRAGIELFALLNYLKYGGIAVLGASYEDLYKLKNVEILTPDYLDPEVLSGGPIENATRFVISENGLDCILTLENTSMLTGVNATNSSNEDAMIYGGAYYSANPTAGLTVYNLTQGLLPEYLGNSFCGNGFRGNIFSSILAQNNDPDTLLIFHAGLSGITSAYTQNFEDTPEFNFRHPSTDGIPFLYRQRLIGTNFNLNPGLTAGVLNINQIQRLCCVPGKTYYKFFWTENGEENRTVIGGGLDGTLWIPSLHLVEFVGILNWIKDTSVSGRIFESNIGSGFELPPVTFLPQPATEKVSSATYSVTGTEYATLIPKRLNVLSQENYFPTDLVGFTGTSFVPRNRRNVESVYSFAYRTAANVLSLFTGNFINNTETRANVVSEIRNRYDAVSLNAYLRFSYTIQCDNFNNTNGSPVLNVDINIAPKQTNIPSGGGLPLKIRITTG